MGGTSALETSSRLTLKALFVPALQRFGDRVAVVEDGVSTSYGQLGDQANRLASVLHDLCVGPGVPVAFLMSNRVEFRVADQAVVRLGAIKVPLNTMLSPAEVTGVLRDSGAKVAIVEATQLQNLDRTLTPDLDHVITVDDNGVTPGQAFQALLAMASADEPPETGVSPDDVGLPMYTGGTTGRPKGIVHTQSALAINLLSRIGLRIFTMGTCSAEVQLGDVALPHRGGSTPIERNICSR